MTPQKRLASQIMECSPYRVKFDSEKIKDIEDAITRSDIRALISQGAITKENARGSSKSRIRINASQRKKGRKKGTGSRKGSKTARLSGKRSWMDRIRLQRKLLFEMRENGLLTPQIFKNLYRKSKGGFFRNKRHVKLYIAEQKLATKK